MVKQEIAIVSLSIGLFCGACEKGDGVQSLPDANRDTDVGITFSIDAAVAADAPLSVDAAASVDMTLDKLTCQDRPTGGESCDPLPDGVFCRHDSCTGGCENECRCKEGTWSCAVVCRDYFSPIPIDCGTPPLCRDACQAATVLPDGGLAPGDANYTIGYEYQIQFTPADMTTLWGGPKLRVAVSAGPSLDKTWLQDLATRMSIRTWPELEEVSTSNTVDATISSSEVGAVSIVPSGNLADRWYALRLSAPPFWVATPTTHVAPDGSYVARFRIGSEPKIASVTFAGGTSKHRLYLAISEPVTSKQSPAAILQVQYAGAQVTCTDVGFVANQPMQMLSFDCPSLSVFPDQIAIGVGLVSTAGAAFAPQTLAKTDLSLNESCGASCQVGVP